MGIFQTPSIYDKKNKNGLTDSLIGSALVCFYVGRQCLGFLNKFILIASSLISGNAVMVN